MKNFLNKKVSVKSLLVLMLVVIAATVALASRPTQIVATLSPDITIMYNGVVQTPRDGNGNVTYPILYNGTTYLPVRAVSNILGIDVGWNQTTRTVSLGEGGTVTPPAGSGSIPGSGGQVNVNGTTQYTFTPSQSGVWVFRTSNNNGDPYLWLYNSAGSLIAEDDDSGGNLNALLAVSLNAGSTYTVRAGFYSTGTGSYTLSVTQSPPLPTSGDTRVNGATMFSFTPNRTGLWTFRTSNNGNSDPYLTILDSDGRVIAEDDDGGGSLNSLVTILLVEGVTYSVDAGFYGYGTGSYTLSVSSTTATTMNASGGSVNVNGATVFSFTPSQSGQWTFRTSNNSGDPYLEIFDTSGNRIAYDDDSGGSLNALITHNLNAGTTYYVFARFYAHGTGSYTLSVTR